METIRNAGRVRAAALAPADPSAQDRAVAAAASAMEAAARAELIAHRDEADAVHRNAPAEGSVPDGQAGAAPVPSAELDAALLAIEQEERVAGTGWRHLHSPDGCAGCAARVAAYR